MIKILLNVLLGFIILNVIFTLVFGLFFPWGIKKYKNFRKKELKMNDEIDRINKME